MRTKTLTPSSRYCGTWQQAYMERHRAILNGHLPPRYLVSVTVEAGFSDRAIGAMTGFMFALLTDRAYQLITYGTLPRFEAALHAHNINWSRPTDPDVLIDNLKFTYRGIRGYTGNRSYGPGVNTSLYWPVYLINDDQGSDFFVRENVSQYPLHHTDTQTVFVASNRGRIVRLFDNPYHRAKLFQMGLRPETAPACIWDFLFTPTVQVYQAMATEFATLQSVSKLKIAINIRVGDHVFSPEADKNTMLETFEHYFRCASEIESFARAGGQEVIWYVTSDSLRLRQLAKQRYGEKVLTQDKMAYFHGDCGDSKEKSFGGCTQATQDVSIQMAVGQSLAISMCDYFVIPQMSGFGLFATWLHGPWHNVYQINSSNQNRTCTEYDYETIETLSRVWTGI